MCRLIIIDFCKSFCEFRNFICKFFASAFGQSVPCDIVNQYAAEYPYLRYSPTGTSCL